MMMDSNRKFLSQDTHRQPSSPNRTGHFLTTQTKNPNPRRIKTAAFGQLRNARLSSYNPNERSKPQTAPCFEVVATRHSKAPSPRNLSPLGDSAPPSLSVSKYDDTQFRIPSFLLRNSLDQEAPVRKGQQHRPFTTNDTLLYKSKSNVPILPIPFTSRGKTVDGSRTLSIDRERAALHEDRTTVQCLFDVPLTQKDSKHGMIPFHFRPSYSLDSFSDAHPGSPKSQEDSTAAIMTRPISQGLKKQIEGPSRKQSMSTAMNNHQERFVVNKGKIIRCNPSFEHFEEILIGLSSELVVDHLMEKIEYFCAKYAMAWVEFSCQKLIDFVSKEGWRLPFLNDVIITSFTINPDEIHKCQHKPGQRYKGIMSREAAVIKIQATWRMVLRRRIFVEHMEKVRAVMAFWGRWNLRKQMAEIRRRRQQTIEEMLEEHSEINQLFYEDWPEHFEGQPRTIIHIPSMSFPEQVRNRMEPMEAWQIRQFARLVDLRDPDVTVVYITLSTDPEFEKFLKYTLSQVFDYQELVRSKRLVIFPVKRPPCFAPSVSLTTILLSNYNALRKLSAFIKNSNAYVIPAYVGIPEVELSVMLGIPILGSHQACSELFCSKVAQRRFAVNAGSLVPPGHDKFTSELDLYEKFEMLTKSYPQYKRWVFKVDKEPDGRGFAYIDIDTLVDAAPNDSINDININCQTENDEDESDNEGDTLKRMRTAQNSQVSQASHMSDEGDEQDGLNGSSHPLRKKLTVWVTYSRRDIWRNWKHFVRAFLRRGGVLEAFLHQDDTSKPATEYSIMHLLLEPGAQEAKVIGSGHQIMIEPFKILGCIFPQFRVEYEKLYAAAQTIARYCSSKQIYGHISCEFIARKQDTNGDYEIYCSSIKPYFTENLAQCYTSLLYANSPINFPDGRFYYNLNIGKKLNLRYLQKATYFDMNQLGDEAGLHEVDPDNEERCVFYTNKLSHKNFELMDAKLFNSLCIDRGLTFSDKWRLGTIIPMFEPYKNTGVSMILAGKNPLNLVEQFLNNLLLMGRIVGGSATVPTNFLDIATYFCRLFGILKPNYIHQPSVTKGVGRLTDLERLLNRYIPLPIHDMQGMIAAEEREVAKSKKGPSMSTTTIQLLNAGVPSKSLSHFYADFGREKLDSDNARNQIQGRIPPGLPLSDYMTVMEQMAGDEPQRLTEEELKIILDGGDWVDPTPFLKQKLVGAGG